MRHCLTFPSPPQENADGSRLKEAQCSRTSLWFTGAVTLLIVTSIKDILITAVSYASCCDRPHFYLQCSNLSFASGVHWSFALIHDANSVCFVVAPLCRLQLFLVVYISISMSYYRGLYCMWRNKLNLFMANMSVLTAWYTSDNVLRHLFRRFGAMRRKPHEYSLHICRICIS